MAEEQNMEDIAHETSSSSGIQPVLLADEASNIKQEFSMPIPGFPPSFQFAKLQTEACSWTSNAAGCSTSCDENVDKTLVAVKTESKSEHPVSSEESDAAEPSNVNGMESASVGENSGLDVVMKLHEEELEEDKDDRDKDKDDEDGARNDEPDEEEAESDPYFYTKRDEFTSEIYKIELQNLPKKCGYKVGKLRLYSFFLVKLIKLKCVLQL